MDEHTGTNDYTGSKEFHALLDTLRQTHMDKSAGYAGVDNPDPFANFRVSERLGIPAFLGALIRKMDKVERIVNILQNPSNERIGESCLDTLIDDSSYALIVRILFEEDVERNTRFMQLLYELNQKLDKEFPREA